MVKFYQSNPSFWKNLDEIVEEHQIVIDRPTGSRHPRYPDFIYPLDYGYLENTKSADGMEMDIWIGTSEDKKITGVLVIADSDKRDSEMKILFACTKKELELLYKINNEFRMNAVMLLREE
ncbi:MAG: inorganic pyrophosphatase [Bacteroidales bacterium]|nr:inorganic pyrophosphatase [Bacteroidales bacterium]